MNIHLYHKTDINLDTSSFTCTEGKYNNGTSEDACNTGTFIENSLNGLPFELIKDYRIKDTNTHYFDVYIYLNNNIDSKMFKTRIFYLDKEVEKEKVEINYYTDPLLEGNDPDLSTGLIPVVYDDTKGSDTHWFVADTTQKWYSYTGEEQWWANAVSVDSSTIEKRRKYVNGDGTYNAGVELATSDMLAMFVWIPRYSYTIGCTSSTSCYGYKIDGVSTLSKSTPGAIDIKFVNKDTKETYTDDSPTYTYTSESDRNPTNWYTHPAFDFGGTPLTGIWVGKFETSTATTASCYNSTTDNCSVGVTEVRILPNVTSMRYQTVYNQYTYSQYFTSNTLYGLTGDSHMMKNREWSAAVYLSQSIYGKYGNKYYSGANKEIYINNYYNTTTDGFITGVSAGAAGVSKSYSITCRYNDITNRGSGTGACGAGASTTGNIYGIYDMSGGARDSVMGNYNNTTSSSGFDSKWFTTTGNAKYYDKFTTTKPFTTKNNETIGQSLYEVEAWYGDLTDDFYDTYTWLRRGGYYGSGSVAGAFDGYSTTKGNANIYCSFRSVLVVTGA